MLRLVDIDVYYGHVHALRKESIEIKKGELVALIGGNGAGKSTTLKAISNINPIKAGEIYFEDTRIDRLSPHALVKRGISHVPEGRQIFPQLTVMENLELGAYRSPDEAQRAKTYETVFTHFPILKERDKQLGSTLSGGEQQMLAIARGLMLNPKLLLLDEPSLGLAPVIVQRLANIITTLNESGLTVLIVEQNARMALKMAHRAYVLESGRVILEGTGEELLHNPEVQRAYLGM